MCAELCRSCNQNESCSQQQSALQCIEYFGMLDGQPEQELQVVCWQQGGWGLGPMAKDLRCRCRVAYHSLALEDVLLKGGIEASSNDCHMHLALILVINHGSKDDIG